MKETSRWFHEFRALKLVNCSKKRLEKVGVLRSDLEVEEWLKMEFEWLFWLVVLGIERIGKRGGDGGLGGSLLQERVV